VDSGVIPRLPPPASGWTSKLPLVGITSSELRRKEQVKRRRHGEPPQTEIALGLTYPQAVLNAGGLPVILTPFPHAALTQLIDYLDGLVISGGPDLHPSSYGQEPHRELGPTEADVDAFELRLCVAARAAGRPILGICRGLQVINVAAGGTLHQHLPDVVGERISHRQPGAGRDATHAVRVQADSRTASLIGPGSVRVNSFHHQAVDVLGEGLRATATASDGVVEAVEGTSDEWVVGVQWHAESLTGRPRHMALFEGLVDAARAARGGEPEIGQIAS
jgi:putative glutamine amidotransferase